MIYISLLWIVRIAQSSNQDLLESDKIRNKIKMLCVKIIFCLIPIRLVASRMLEYRIDQSLYVYNFLSTAVYVLCVYFRSAWAGLPYCLDLIVGIRMQSSSPTAAQSHRVLIQICCSFYLRKHVLLNINTLRLLNNRKGRCLLFKWAGGLSVLFHQLTIVLVTSFRLWSVLISKVFGTL